MSKDKKTFLEKYAQDTRVHVYSLVLILPLVLIYEGGILLINECSFGRATILANELIVLIFERLGLRNVNIIPAILVMATLFAMQWKSGKSWNIRLSNVFMLHIEYILYAVLFFISVSWIFPGRLIFRVPRAAEVILSIGAGVYEEYLFRLLFLSALILFFKKSLNVENKRTLYTAVVISAVCFAGFHHILGRDPFRWSDFCIRSAAGVYFGFIFLTRGYGVCAGTHIGFNILRVMFC